MKLIYGGGLRKNECLRLRIKDLDFKRGALNILAGKGDKDRQTLLSPKLEGEVNAHICEIKKLYDKLFSLVLCGKILQLRYSLSSRHHCSSKSNL